MFYAFKLELFLRNSILPFLTLPFVWIFAVATPVPDGIEPFSDSVILSYKTKAEAMCSKTVTSKESKPDLKVKLSIDNNKDQSADFSMSFDDHGNEFKISFELNAEKTKTLDKNPIFRRNGILASDADAANLLKEAGQMMDILRQGFTMWAGIPLRQGVTVPFDSCAVGFKQQSKSHENFYAPIGKVTIAGRRSIVFSGSESSTCQLDNTYIEMKQSGWFAFDIETGLPVSSSITSSTVIPNKINLQQSDDTSCVIKSEPTPLNVLNIENSTSSSSTSISERLEQLKKLFDKGLISNEQRKLKESQILEGL